MPELRGIQAEPEVKEEWKRAYAIYLRAPGDRYDKKKDRTERINFVAHEMRLTRKQAKRRVRNYEAWQRNIKKGLVPRDEPNRPPAAAPQTTSQAAQAQPDRQGAVHRPMTNAPVRPK